MAADRKIFIEVEFDDKGARAKLIELDRQTDKLGKTAVEKGAVGMTALERAMTRANVVGGLIERTIFRTAEAIGRAFVDGISRAIKLSADFNNALIGLSTIAGAFGANADVAKQAAVGLARDGLMTVADAAMGLKNLLSTGFSLPESIVLMNRFKDAAAFNRQASLDFGTAVVRTTEGIRMGLSTLADAGGMTKNLSQILAENGAKMTDLSRVSSDAGVRMALFKGIMKETAPQVGDASKLLGTYTGAVSRLGTAWDMTLIAVGEAVTQNATVAALINKVAEAVSSLSSDLFKNGTLFNLVSDSIVFVTKAASVFFDVLDTGQLVLASVQLAVYELAKGLANIAIFLNRVAMAIPGSVFDAQLQDNINNLGAAIGELNRREEAVTQRSIEWGNALQTMSAKSATLSAELAKTRGQMAQVGGSTARITQETAANTKETEKAVKAQEKWTKGIDDAQVKAGLGVFNLNKYNQQVHTLTGITQASHDAIMAWTESLEGANSVEVKAIDHHKAATEALEAQLQTLSKMPQRIRTAAEAYRKESGPGGMFSGMGTVISQGISNAIVASFTGGGDPVKASGALLGTKLGENFVGRFGTTVTSKLGATLGGALNALIPGIGSLLGPLMSKIGSKIANLFRGSEESRLVNKPRDQFMAEQGGFDALSKSIFKATGNLELMQRLLNAKTEKDYKAAVDAINVALGDFDKKLADLGVQTTDTKNKLGTLTSMTPGLEAALETVYNAQTPQEYADALARVNSEIDTAKSKTQQVDEALKRWGLSWENLGENARALKLGELLTEIKNDYDLLTQAGGDHSVILEKMAPKVNEYVQAAIRSGTEIPSSMRPILEGLLKMGKLTDENGVKLDSLDSIKFGETFEESTKKITEAMDRMTSSLDRIIDAFGRIPRTVNVDINTREHRTSDDYVPPPEAHSGMTVHAGGRRGRVLPFVVAHNGINLAHDEVPAILQTGERVLNRRETRDYNAGRGGMVVHINISKPQLRDRQSVRELAQDVRRALDERRRQSRRVGRAS